MFTHARDRFIYEAKKQLSSDCLINTSDQLLPSVVRT